MMKMLYGDFGQTIIDDILSPMTIQNAGKTL